jgi:F0F1-type ATP synthase assembly protein I
MEPLAPRSFPPVEAGTLLALVIGWAIGSFGPGLIVGAVVGLPAGVIAVYRRYRGYFS